MANHVLRFHLPLTVPGHKQGLSGLWVRGEKQEHKPGEIVCFDDSKLHRAFNNSVYDRVVLIVDVARPDHVPKGTAVGGTTDQLLAFIDKFR